MGATPTNVVPKSHCSDTRFPISGHGQWLVQVLHLGYEAELLLVEDKIRA